MCINPWTRTWTQSSAIGACRQANHHEGTGTFVEVVNEEKVCRSRTLYVPRAPIRSAQTWQQRAHDDDVVIYTTNHRTTGYLRVYGCAVHTANKYITRSSGGGHLRTLPIITMSKQHHTNDGPSGKKIVWIIRICRVGREFIAHHSSANPTQQNRDTTTQCGGRWETLSRMYSFAAGRNQPNQTHTGYEWKPTSAMGKRTRVLVWYKGGRPSAGKVKTTTQTNLFEFQIRWTVNNADD